MTRIERQSEVFARTNHKEATALSYPGPQVEIDQELIDVLEGNPKREKNAPRSLNELANGTQTTFQVHAEHDHSTHAPSQPEYSFKNPPKKYGVLTRTGYVVIGSLAAVLAGAAWTVDSLLHFFGVPHGTVLHPFLAAATMPAIIWLNNAWRGYSVTGKGAFRSAWDTLRTFGKEHSHDHDSNYSGQGYPVSGTTYAQENLNGHYSQSRTSRAISHVVINVLAPIAHGIEGFFHEASHVARDIWSRPLHPAWIFSIPARILATAVKGFAMGWYKGVPQGYKNYTRDKKAAAPKK